MREREQRKEEKETKGSPVWMDSTSKLFSRLDLAENFTSARHEDMDDMDIDLVEEANPRMESRRKKHTRHWRGSGPRNFGSRSTTRNDTEQQHGRATLVQLINNALETEDSSQALDEVLESEQNKVSNEATKSIRSFEKSSKLPAPVPSHPQLQGLWRKKGKEQLPVFDGGDLFLKSREKRADVVLHSDQFQSDVSWRNQGQSRRVPNVYIAPCNSIEADGQCMDDLVDRETCSSFINTSKKDKMKGLDSSSVSQPKTGQAQRRWSKHASLPNNTEPRRLVHDGYTSHYNVAQGKSVSRECGVGTMIHYELLDGNNHVSHVSEGSNPDKKKGKMIVEDKFLSSGQDIKAECCSDRLCSVAAKEVYASADDDNAFISSEDMAWRRYDSTSKAPVRPYEESVCVSKSEEATSCHLCDLRHKISTEYGDHSSHVHDSPEITISNRLCPTAMLPPPESQTRRRGNHRHQRRQKLMKGKRECNLICSDYGGSSSSTFENSETSHLESSRHNTYTGLTRTLDSQHHGDIIDPVIELNEQQSPDIRRNNHQERIINIPDDSTTGVSQVESDEILARRLQEQFYDEVARSAGTEEIDATIAWSLQQEDAQLAASTARSDQSDHREASMAHLYAYYAQLPYRNTSARSSHHAQSRTSNRRRNYYGSEIDLETRMMAQVRNFTGMDLGMRRNFLETLEAAFDQSNGALAENAFETHPDFNEYDYEMLLALDENNHHQVGASESQINSLPQSVNQSDNVEEACAICLEQPTVGDIIRHLPCLHKFHKKCIDTWLKMRTWCPVCKSEIT